MIDPRRNDIVARLVLAGLSNSSLPRVSDSITDLVSPTSQVCDGSQAQPIVTQKTEAYLRSRDISLAVALIVHGEYEKGTQILEQYGFSKH